MSINPNNYPGVSATLVGWAASDPRNPAYDKNGERGVKQVSIAINEGYKKDGEFVQTGTTWYDIEAGGDAVQALMGIRKGDKIRVDDAKQEVRAYTSNDGTEKLGITLKFGRVTILESKTGGAGYEDDSTPF